MTKILHSIRRIYLGYRTEESSSQLQEHASNRNFLSFQVQENCWGEQRKKETGGEKYGLRLHCPFTKELDIHNFVKVSF